MCLLRFIKFTVIPDMKRIVLSFFGVLVVLSFSYSELILGMKPREFRSKLKKVKLLQSEDTLAVYQVYFFSHEVTNLEYRFFLEDIKNLSPAVYSKYLPDTLVHRDDLQFGEPYMELYFRHPAYNDYPVVGVSYDQAMYFCQWLTAKYKGTRIADYIFDLPTQEEWEIAARGRDLKAKYSWDEKSFWKGEKANYKGADCLEKVTHVSRKGSCWEISFEDYGDDLSHSEMYKPNSIGLFNMCGNVSEFVKERGILKGGNANDSIHDLEISKSQLYTEKDYVSSKVGFRFVARVKKWK